MTTSTADPERQDRVELRLDLEGMTCASCAARIEKRLNGLDGVEATVNFATEQATVHCDADVPVERARRRGRVGRLRRASRRRRTTRTARRASAPRRAARACSRAGSSLAVVLTVPVALLAMVPPLQFAGWEWVALALSTPVVFYSGVGFHRAALRSARHGAATMDTLISLGTLAAWLVVDRRARRRARRPTPTSRSPPSSRR